jgi:hypothetical protein
MSTTDLQGGCFCGAVRYRLTSAPMFVNCCHCHDCQRQTGSGFVINAVIEADRVELLGETPVGIVMKTDSGRPHEIHRCASCQVAVWSLYGGRTKVRFVRVGTLDDPSALPPDAHVFVRSKLPWVELSPSQPQFEIFYELETQWPAASRARRAAVLG